MNITPFETTDPDVVDTAAETQPWYHIEWSEVLPWLGEFGWRIVQCVLVALLCYVIARVLRLGVRRIVNRIVSGAKSRANVDDTQALQHSPLADMRLVQRTRTLGSILQNVINTVMVVIALLWMISIAAPGLLSSFTLLTAAVGAGLGFGAQNIVKDGLNGIFIVADDQVGIGDVVDLGLATGVVENVNIRTTEVRDVNGTLWYVRNGEITRIGNMSQGWARVIVDVGASATLDLEQVETVMLSTAQELAKDPHWRTRIIGKPEVWGLESLDGDRMLVRVVMKTRTNAKDDVAEELRGRLRTEMAAAKLPLESLQSARLEGAQDAQRIRGANSPTPRSKTRVATPERGVWKPASTTEGDVPSSSIGVVTDDLPPGKVTGPIPSKPITKPIQQPPSGKKPRRPKKP